MPKPKQERATTNAIGKKINQVMRDKDMAGDYAALARVFSVAVPSVYGWIDNGTIAKARYDALVEWSGKSLTWWFGTEAEAPETGGGKPVASERPSRYDALKWPFSAFSHSQWVLLDRNERGLVEAYALGLLHAKRAARKSDATGTTG